MRNFGGFRIYAEDQSHLHDVLHSSQGAGGKKDLFAEGSGEKLMGAKSMSYNLNRI
jgi:hypothetical protein